MNTHDRFPIVVGSAVAAAAGLVALSGCSSAGYNPPSKDVIVVSAKMRAGQNIRTAPVVDGHVPGDGNVCAQLDEEDSLKPNTKGIYSSLRAYGDPQGGSTDSDGPWIGVPVNSIEGSAETAVALQCGPDATIYMSLGQMIDYHVSEPLSTTAIPK